MIMISLWLENQNSFGETYGVSLQIIRSLQSGYKTCRVELMLKIREDRYYHRKFGRDTWLDAKLEVTRSRLSLGVLVKEFW